MSRDPLRHHKHRTKGVFGESPAERLAESFASFMGTVRFLFISTLVIVSWVVLNGFFAGVFDPFPFILLNLVFSAFAFYTGALVIIAQKAQSKKDQLHEEAEAKHREELAVEHSDLLVQNTELTKQIHDLTSEIRAMVNHEKQ